MKPHGLAHHDLAAADTVEVSDPMPHRTRPVRLVTLDAPGPERYWYTDGAYAVTAGWQVRHGAAPGVVRERSAHRTSTGPKPFKGQVTVFR